MRDQYGSSSSVVGAQEKGDFAVTDGQGYFLESFGLASRLDLGWSMRDIPGLDIGITKILWVSDKFGASRKEEMASRVRGVGSVCKWRSMLEEGTLAGRRGERPVAQHTGRHSRNPPVEKGGGAVSLAGTLMIRVSACIH